MTNKTLNAISFETPLGSMIAVADQDALYLLEFIDRTKLEIQLQNLKQKTKKNIIFEENKILKQAEKEMQQYFTAGKKMFSVPIKTCGTSFQEKVWQTLQKIPSGETWSYQQLAEAIGQPTAYRAVANSNSKNKLAIIIPCHRVINADGKLGGYAGGLDRKEWLLNHEAR